MRAQVFDLDGNMEDVVVPGAAQRCPTFEEAPPEFTGGGKHLFSPNGFLDDAWMHRSYWLYGKNYAGGCSWWHQAGRFAPAGRILAFDEHNVYGFGRKPHYFLWTSALEYQLFSAVKQVDEQKMLRVINAHARSYGQESDTSLMFDRPRAKTMPLEDISAVDYKWRVDDPPMRVRALALAGR